MTTTETWNDFDEMSEPTVHSDLVLAALNLRRNEAPDFRRAILVPLGLAAIANHLTGSVQRLEVCLRCNTAIRPEGGHVCGDCGRNI